MALATSIIARRVYPSRYEYSRLAKITASVVLVLGIYYWIPADVLGPSALLSAAWKLALLALFLLAMYAMKVFEPAEVAAFKNLMKGRKEVPQSFESGTKSVDGGGPP
jgi:hypothetical protein